MLKHLLILLCISLASTLCAAESNSNPYPLPSDGSQLIGKTFKVRTRHRNNLSDIGMRYDIGFHEMVEANQDIRPWRVRKGTEVLVPKRFLLPKPYKGIIINLAELRLYYYPKDRKEVWTFPIGIGRVGWNTPTTKTTVIRKAAKPVWYVPESIRDFVFEMKGVLLPKKVLPGPENPLGNYAIYLALHGYLIHGTNAPWSIGKRVSSGCIRMLPGDIETLYHMVKKGTPVRIINEPFKAGWHQQSLYFEAHKPLSDEAGNLDYHIVLNKVTAQRKARIDWNLVKTISEEQQGLPSIIGHASNS